MDAGTAIIYTTSFVTPVLPSLLGITKLSVHIIESFYFPLIFFCAVCQFTSQKYERLHIFCMLIIYYYFSLYRLFAVLLLL